MGDLDAQNKFVHRITKYKGEPVLRRRKKKENISHSWIVVLGFFNFKKMSCTPDLRFTLAAIILIPVCPRFSAMILPFPPKCDPGMNTVGVKIVCVCSILCSRSWFWLPWVVKIVIWNIKWEIFTIYVIYSVHPYEYRFWLGSRELPCLVVDVLESVDFVVRKA